MALIAWVLALVADVFAIRKARIISTFSAEARGRWRAFPERTAAVLTTGANDLKNQLALALEVSGESDAIAAGPLDTESSDVAEALCPHQQSRVAASCGRDLEVTEVAAESVFGVSDVAVLVGVDADDDAYWIVCVCDAGYCHRPSYAGLIGGRLPGGRTALRWGLCQPPIKSLLAR